MSWTDLLTEVLQFVVAITLTVGGLVFGAFLIVGFFCLISWIWDLVRKLCDTD